MLFVDTQPQSRGVHQRKGEAMLNTRNRAVAAVTAAAIALTSVAVAPATAAPASKPQVKSQVETSGATDFSSQRRRYYRNDRAAAGVMLGIIGAVGAYAAAREYRKAQEHRYRSYYDGGYGYYGGPHRYGYGGPHRYYGY
jgi:hypothetical protein